MKGIGRMKVEIGNKITLFNGEEFRVVDILKHKNKDYMYLLNINDPDKSFIYEYRKIDDKVQVKKEKDEKIIEEVMNLIKNNGEEN